MIEKAIFSKLTTTQTIAAIVGTRVFPVFLPEKTALPALVFRRVSTEGAALSHSGPSGLVTSEFDVECYSKELASAKTLAVQVRKTFSGWSGTAAGVVVHRSMVDDEFDDYDFESGLYTIVIQIFLTHHED